MKKIFIDWTSINFTTLNSLIGNQTKMLKTLICILFDKSFSATFTWSGKAKSPKKLHSKRWIKAFWWNHLKNFPVNGYTLFRINRGQILINISSHTTNGRTVYYYCNRVTARTARKCPVKLKVFESDTEVTFGVSVTTFVHDHSATKSRTTNQYSDATKKEVYTLKTDFSMRPKLIHKQLARTHPNESTPKVAQVRRILQEQIATLTPPTISYGQLHEWCKSQMGVP